MPIKPRATRFAFFLPLLLLPLAGAQTPAPVPSAPVTAPVPPAAAAAAVPAAAPAVPANNGWNWLSDLLPNVFRSNPTLQMTVITEMTDEGRKLPPVSKEHPVYYDSESGGYHEMGELNAHQEKLPPDEVGQMLTRGLAVNGFEPAKVPEHPPSLLIIYIWGTHNAITATDANDNSTSSPEEVRRNVLDRAALVGGKKFAEEVNEVIEDSQLQAEVTANAGLEHLQNRGTSPVMATQFTSPVNFFKMRAPNNEFLLNQALDDVYYVVASAFDYQAVAKGEPKLLWRTRMTVSSQGISVKQALPAVMASAASHFGREMAESEIIHGHAVPEGKVEVGAPTVVDPLSAPPTPETK